MDIAALSMGLQQINMAQAVQLRVMNMATDQAEQQSQQLIQMMEQSVQPHLGGQIDIRA